MCSIYHTESFILDVDECNERTSNCEQSCVNTQGSYHCVCSPGYQLNTDKHTCLKGNTTSHRYQLHTDKCLCLRGNTTSHEKSASLNRVNNLVTSSWLMHWLFDILFCVILVALLWLWLSMYFYLPLVSSEAACIARQCPQGCRLKPSGEAECFCFLGYRMRPDSSCEGISILKLYYIFIEFKYQYYHILQYWYSIVTCF